MKPANIDLEQEEQDESATLQVTPGEKEADEAVDSAYPHFHFETPEELKIPKSGTMQVEYEIVFSTGDDETGYKYKVDLHKITGIESPGNAKPEKTEEALDRLAEERMQGNSNV